MESHRGMLSEDENDEETEKDVGREANKNILNLMHDRHFDKLPQQLDWRDYGKYVIVWSCHANNSAINNTNIVQSIYTVQTYACTNKEMK